MPVVWVGARDLLDRAGEHSMMHTAERSAAVTG